jgi:hypothetical protein
MTFYVYKFTNKYGELENHLFIDDQEFPVVMSTDYNKVQEVIFDVGKDYLDKPTQVTVKDVTYLGKPATLFIMELDKEPEVVDNVISLERK